MPRPAATIQTCDVERAIRAVQRTDLTIAEILVTRQGARIIIVSGAQSCPDVHTGHLDTAQLAEQPDPRKPLSWPSEPG